MPAPCSIGAAPSSEKALILQLYLALHSQQSSVRRRLEDCSPPISPMSMRASPSPDMSSSEPSSASQSPVMGAAFPQLSPPLYALPSTANRKRSSRPSIAPIPEDDLLDEFEISHAASSVDDAERLYNINHDIKTTLTDLLNCDAVRNDGKMRLWIQSRLMDAEKELKQRRKARQRLPSLAAAPTPAIILTPDGEIRRASS